MSLRYSEVFIEQALIKVYSRGERTVGSVAEELNINCHTVKNWMKRKVANQVSESWHSVKLSLSQNKVACDLPWHG